MEVAPIIEATGIELGFTSFLLCRDPEYLQHFTREEEQPFPGSVMGYLALLCHLGQGATRDPREICEPVQG